MPKKCVPIYEEVDCPFRPDEVPLSGEMSDQSTFGSGEVEEIAGHLIKFFKSRGHWCAFTIDELRRYYVEHHWDPNMMFYGLMGAYIHYGGMGPVIYTQDESMLVVDTDGKYCVTDLFVKRCCRRLKKAA